MTQTASSTVIEEIMLSVFETMMGLKAEPADIAWYATPDRVSATIQINGSSSGVLVLETDEPNARKFAGCLLGMEAPDTVDDDVRDALGELANVIGGNLKDKFEPSATLSLPFVVDGSDFKIRVCHGTVVEQHAFLVEGATLWLSWIVQCAGSAGEKSPSSAPSRETVKG